MAYVAAERLAYWLTDAGVQTEVLGYTTDQFKVYKSFQERIQPQQSHDKMSGLLNSPMRGTPTGAATIWAHDRLLATPHQRKILLVLTDGEPDEGEKIRTADVNYWIENKSPVELAGVGIMHDVSEDYVRHIYVEKPSDLITSVAQQIKAMMDRPMESHRRIRRRPVSAASVFKLKITSEKKPPRLTK